MISKRHLTDEELKKIRDVEDILKGDLNRMYIAEDSDELMTMYHYVNDCIKTIFDINLNRFIYDMESEE